MTRRWRTRWTTVVIAAATLTVSCVTLAPQPALPADTGSAGADRVTANELLANAVYSKLNADPVYYFRHVNVTVDHGVAQLSGYVWSTDAIYRARYLAQSVAGISGVATSQLELERNGRTDGVAR
jgi:hypothetical protein